MRIVTLITDFGTKGYRSAALKGALLSACEAIQLVDITHEIEPFDIDEAAFILRSCYTKFPTGTVHVVNVYNYYEQENKMVFFKFEDNYFVGPDNGVFSLVFEDLDVPIYTLGDNSTLHYTKVCAAILSGLSEGKEINEIGEHLEDIKRKLILQPVIAKNEIRGAVIFVDRYGNVTVNIKKRLFEQVQNGRQFSLFFNRHEHITNLSEHYMQVDIGSPLCNFNSQQYLEVAVNLQRADELLGLKKGDVIQIKFQD